MLTILTLMNPAFAQTLTCDAGDTLCDALDEAAAAVNASLGTPFLHDGSGAVSRASMPRLLTSIRAGAKPAMDAGCTVGHWMTAEYDATRFQLQWDAVGNGAPLAGRGRKRTDRQLLGLAYGSGPLAEDGGWYSSQGQVVAFPGVDPDETSNDFLIGRFVRTQGSRGVVVAANLTCDATVDPFEATDRWFRRDLSTLEPTEVPVSLELRDFPTSAFVPGAVATTPDGEMITDAEGFIEFTVPAHTTTPVPISVTGYPDTLWYAHAGIGLASTRTIPSTPAIAQLAGALGLTVDPTKAIINYTAFEFDGLGEGSQMEAVTIDLDVPYAVALVADASSPLGFSLGNTTLAGSAASVIFVNVDAGDANVTVTPPAGYWCWEGEGTYNLPAGNFVMLGASCVSL